MWGIYLLLPIALAILVDGECDGNLPNKNTSWIPLNETYCLLNNCTIRIEESNILLNIVNNTEELIIAANGTNLFTLSADNDTVTSCSVPEDPGIGFFIFITTVGFVIIISSSGNIVLHLVVKELRTIAGIIVIEICVTVIISGICQMLTALLQHVYRVNEDTEAVCAVAKYAITASTLFYTITKATYLLHFAYLMYRTFRPLPDSRLHENKKLLCIYGIFDVIAGTTATVLVIVTDLLYEKTAFNTYNGYCTASFRDLDDSVSNRVLLVIYSLFTVLQVIFFILALTFYCLATKQLQAYRMARPSGIRVSVTLISAIALGALLLVVLLLAGVRGESSIMSAGITVLVEQTVLLIVFLTSKKVRAKLKCGRRYDNVPLLKGVS